MQAIRNSNSSCSTLMSAYLPVNVTRVFECADWNSDFVLRVGGIQSAPMMRIGRDKKLTGLVVDVLRYLSRVLKLSYLLFECGDPQMGFRLKNGQWTGCLGMVQRQEMDLFLMPAAPSESRMRISIPTAPLVNADLILMSGSPEKISVTSLSGLNHFHIKVWISFTSAFVLVVCLSLLSESLWKTRAHKLGFIASSKIIVRKKPTRKIKVARTVFAFLGTLMFQSLPFTHPDDSWRILLATWSFSIMVVMTLFSGQLTAAMTVSNKFILIDSLNDILKNKNLRPVIMAATSFEYFFRDAQPGSEPRLVHEQANRLGGLVPFKDHANRQDMHQMFHHKSVIIGPPFAMKGKIGSFCRGPPKREIHFSKDHYFERMMTMSLRLGIPRDIAENINIKMQRYMDAGHVVKFVQSMELNASQCAWTEPKNDQERTLEMKNVSGPFLLWTFGLGISLFVLMSEIIWYRLRCNKRPRRLYSRTSLTITVSRGTGGKRTPVSRGTGRKRTPVSRGTGAKRTPDSRGTGAKRTPVTVVNMKRQITFYC